ncbi:MAG: endonuclease [Alphaproteobacteria bacterium]|nr:endonuclease [Alphaproteobacteria bacterium]
MRVHNFILKMLFFICLTTTVQAEDKVFYANESYASARNKLFKKIYIDHRSTLYCQIPFDEDKKLILPKDFDVSKVSNRVNRIEMEHVVTAEEFGTYIKQWWMGDKNCINKENIPYKGRRCAEKTSRIFRLMQSDMYNLYPVIGSLNTIRGNTEFTEFPTFFPSIYKTCSIKVADNKIEIPDSAKGIVARTYLYFEKQYPFFKIKESQKELFIKWDEKFPPDEWECLRTYRIEEIQKNENTIVKQQCINQNLWPQK